jgi:hypothetical protein
LLGEVRALLLLPEGVDEVDPNARLLNAVVAVEASLVTIDCLQVS